ncbi:MAG: hypothetical protein R3E89_01245 [Thiolinea sp.]
MRYAGGGRLCWVGSGLHPEFSGIENARIGLALRGLDRVAIERLFA